MADAEESGGEDEDLNLNYEEMFTNVAPELSFPPEPSLPPLPPAAILPKQIRNETCVDIGLQRLRPTDPPSIPYAAQNAFLQMRLQYLDQNVNQTGRRQDSAPNVSANFSCNALASGVVKGRTVKRRDCMSRLWEWIGG